MFQDAYTIKLDEELAPGDYVLSTGMYDVYTSERLPVFEGGGQRIEEDRIILANVRVQAAE